MKALSSVKSNAASLGHLKFYAAYFASDFHTIRAHLTRQKGLHKQLPCEVIIALADFQISETPKKFNIAFFFRKYFFTVLFQNFYFANRDAAF